MTNASFNIVSRGLWQLFTEPGSRHPGWVAQLTAGRNCTALTIPEWVISIESTIANFSRIPQKKSFLTKEGICPTAGEQLVHGQCITLPNSSSKALDVLSCGRKFVCEGHPSHIEAIY